jgi:hypothetical protein
MCSFRIPFLLVCVVGVIAARPAYAERTVWCMGRVVDLPRGKPLAGAIVAVYDEKNRVIDYARTGPDGDYALLVPRSALNVDKKSRGGFLHQAASGVGRLAGGAGRIASYPLKVGVKVAASAAGGGDPLTRVGVGVASGLALSVVDGLSGGDRKKAAAARAQPGALLMKVSLPGRNDIVGIARIYWMQEEVFRADRGERREVTAWFDPVKLAEAGASQVSAIDSTYLTFADARLEPSIAERGQLVTISATLPQPPEPAAPVVVIARNSRNGTMCELAPVGGGRYRGEVLVDKRFPRNDQAICIVAYPQQPGSSTRSRKVEDAIVRAGMLSADRPFLYDPMLVASRNRAEVVLTVVDAPRKR